MERVEGPVRKGEQHTLRRWCLRSHQSAPTFAYEILALYPLYLRINTYDAFQYYPIFRIHPVVPIHLMTDKSIQPTQEMQVS